jgi:predicted NBD/HSP70 family sugar kinase
VAELLRENLVIEQGEEDSTGGRPAIGLELNEARCQAVGVDIQNWDTRVSVGTISGRIVETHGFRTPPTPEKTLDFIAEQVETCWCDSSQSSLHGVGVSTRGLVNRETGVVELGHDAAWIDVAIKQRLEERLEVPVYVENNVRAAALAEYHYGTPDIQETHCLLLVKVDEGVGMGIVMDGKLYSGPRMAAGEFGQMVIADSPGPERHDRPGCLEMLVSDLVTSERYQRLVGTRARANFGSPTEHVKQICHLAMQGDPAARQAIEETSRYLGIGLANAIWALDADAVVIDGALTEAWPLVVAGIREQLPDGGRFLNFRNLMLRPSSLRGEAAIIGAMTLPFAGLFSSGESVRM